MPSERLPKKTKANGFWTFATSVRAQLLLYNPSEAASYVTHSQELWEVNQSTLVNLKFSLFVRLYLVLYEVELLFS